MLDAISDYTPAQLLAMLSHEAQRLAAGEPMASHLGPWLELDENDQEDAVQRAAQWLTVLGHLHLCAQATSDDHPCAPVVAHEYISTLISEILQGNDPF